MPEYRLDDAAARSARQLIDSEGFAAFAARHLAEDPDASEGTEGRYALPYGDVRTVDRAALVHAEQRASQNDHDAIEEVAGELLRRLDEQRDG